MSSLLILARVNGKAMFWRTVMCGYRAYDWNTIAMSRSLGAFSLTRSPAMVSSPDEMSSSPAIMFSVVDLPQPEGPTRMMNSPSAMFRLTSCTAAEPSAYVLDTWLSTISAIANPSLHRRSIRRRSVVEI
ncbi:Uncharacterised protein [Mycobacteroides abscessus subsp. massiliense]|nr:Uncharacterised protein [Mycobacteroides abscessus subsp. massiliense]